MKNNRQPANKHPLFIVVLGCTLLAWASTATAADREHGAHVHGVGTLNVAVDGPSVEIEFESPGANIVGFEHAAKLDKDQRAIKTATAALTSGEKLFTFPKAAGCRLMHAEVEAPPMDEPVKHGHDKHAHDKHAHDKHGHDKHGHDKHGKDDEAHSEFHALYRFRCNRPAHLTYIDIHIFRQFPATRELKVQSISPHGQRAQTLTSAAAKLMF